jgi:serine protease Do
MRTTDLFDDYLEGRLGQVEQYEFENRLKTDVVFSGAFAEHKKLIDTLRSHEQKNELRSKLRFIHDKEFGASNIKSIKGEQNFAARHGKTIAVAASTAFIAVLGTVAILSTGGFLLRQQSNEITELKRNVMELKSSSDGIVEGITKSKKVIYAPANFEGSAFALNNKGYIITSYHMVKGSDSIFVRNSNTDRLSASIVLTDPAIDLAILKVNNKEAYSGWQVPFTFRERSSEIGDKVFTLGYPRREMVYGEGSLSSLSGYYNDTSMYQISIPVNPGNSGGPLLDENGSIIGVIRGKISGAEATGFAIKSGNILKAVEDQAGDSLKADLLTISTKKAGLRGLKRSEKIRKINPYVFNVLVYKKE